LDITDTAGKLAAICNSDVDATHKSAGLSASGQILFSQVVGLYILSLLVGFSAIVVIGI
jgi:hypothetical protein